MEQIEILRPQDFLSSGGEMGRRIRNFDWSKTPLGEPQHWSESLKNVVSLMLANRLPMLLWWGKEYIQFYNDAYIPIPGLKHPLRVLGVPGHECWAEIWDVIGPLVDTPFKGGPPTWMDDILLLLNRNNFIEETHFIIAYSPVPDTTAPNGIGGVLATVNEITDSVISKRQMETLKELGKNISVTLSANEVYEKAAEVLKSNLFDIPFALIYKIEDEGTVASLAATSGIAGVIDIPRKINLQKPGTASADIASAVAENKMIEAINRGELKTLPKGAWDTTPSIVVHVPVKAANKKFPSAIISIGLNPYRKFDDGYKNFLTLISDQLSLGVSNAIAYEEERKRSEALQKLDQAKTVFFSNISHEFRTPLTLMLGTIEEALSDATTTESNIQRMTVTHRNAMRLLKLVNTLLDFSRIESRRQKANYVRTDIVSLTTNLAANFRSVVEKAGLTFDIKSQPIVEPVYADKPMWEKIVFNLLSNAFKYTLEGTITVNLFTEKKLLILEVQDTGVGIPEKELPHMFERFHRVQQVTGRTYEGTGIGLSLIKELIQLHGGTINVASKVNKGSTFRIAIPHGKDHLPAEQVSETGEELENIIVDPYIEEVKSLLAIDGENTSSITRDKRTPAVLVVDDNADMRQHIQSILQKHFTVITAVNGLDALHKIKIDRPGLILSDIMMPVMDGIQLIKEIRNNSETAALPIILLTARAGEESKTEGFEMGADDYLVKPFAANELVTRIRAQVKLAQSRERIAASEKQFKNVLLQSPSIFMILESADMRISFVNEPLLKSWNKDWSIVGKTLLEVLPELKDQPFPKLLNQVYTSGVELNGKEEKAVLINNGVAVDRYYNYVYQPIFETDNSVSGITIMANDVTEQVVARKKVEESERELQVLVKQAPVSIVLFEGERLITRVANDVALQVMGKTEKQVLNKSFYEYFPELNDRMNIYKQVFHSGKPYVGKEENITYNRNNEMYTGYFDVNYSPWYDSDGKIKGVIALGVEVTEKVIARRKIENISAELELKVKERTVQLQTKNIELEETRQTLELKNVALSGSLNKLELLFKKLQDQKLKDEQKDDFILMASHELKTPLTTINGYVQLLMDLRTTVDHKADDMPLFDSALKTIHKQIINLTGLVSELLDLSKIDKGQLELHKTEFDLADLVTDVVTDVQYTTQHKIELDISSRDKVNADKDRIMQVILNFITNAIKYSPGEDKIEIKVFHAKNGQAAVSVKDNGIGIDETDHEKIFERFYRAEGKTEKTFPGFGIGLFIASDIIKRHDGTIGVKSKKNEGAEFIFTLPVPAN